MKKLVLFLVLVLFSVITIAQVDNRVKTLTITAGAPAAGWGSLNVDYSINLHYVTSTAPVTLTSSWTISAMGTPTTGLTYKFYYDADVTLGVNNVTFFGTSLTALQAGSPMIITASWLGGAWAVSVVPDLSSGTLLVIDETQVNIDALDNSNIDASAGIELTKLAASTANMAIVTDASGFLIPSTTRDAEIGFLTGLSSNAQTQINTKATSGAIVNSDIAAGAAIVHTKMAPLTVSRTPVIDASGYITASAITSAELAYLSGNTGGNIQAQIDATAGKTLVEGSIYVGSVTDEVGAVDIKTSGNILIGNGTTAASQTMSGDATLNSSGVLTLGTAAVTPSNTDDNLSYDLVFVIGSFESGYTGDKKIRVPYNSNLTHAYICVEKLIEASNDAVLHFEDHTNTNMGGGSLSGGDLTITAGSATGTIVQTEISSNNNFAAGETLTLETRKSTVGGTIWISLRFERID